MIILGVDLGSARTGVAVCDKTELLATPLEVIQERDRTRLAERLTALAAERKAEAFVLGLPRNMDGSEGGSAAAAREFGAALAEMSGLPVEFSDERGTTLTAHNLLNDVNARGKRRKAAVDAVAATLILQNYLDMRRMRRG